MPLDGFSLKEVIATARKAAHNKSRTYFVIYEDEHNGCYHAVDEQTLDTFYSGTSDDRIMYCTDDPE